MEICAALSTRCEPSGKKTPRFHMHYLIIPNNNLEKLAGIVIPMWGWGHGPV